MAALIIFAAIETWGAFLPVTYDEPWYLDTVAGIDLHGAVSYVFIRDFPGPTGPLHAWLHWLLRPITHLEPPLVRVVNPVLAALATCATAAAIRQTRGNSPWGTALLIAAVPMAWPCAGMALTEVPAMLLYSVHLLLLLAGWNETVSRTQSITCSILAGVAIGFAILGRQPLLLTLAALMACGLLERRRLLAATVCCAAALAICVPVFMIWGGLTPQTMAGNVAARRQAGLVIYGLVPWHIAYAMAYSGITVAIVAPRCVDARWRAWALVVAACMAV